MSISNVNVVETNNNSGFSQSLWMQTHLQAFPALNEDLRTEVCIVGGGIAGLTCAYVLAKQGKSVVVLDQGKIAGGQTARTTGHLTWVLDDRYYDLEKYHGQENARLVAESHSKAIDYIERIIKEENIDCDFERVNGYLFVPPDESTDVLEREFVSVRKAGMNIEKVSRAPFTSFDTGQCLCFPNQAQFHILKYIQGLVKAIKKYGGQIYADSHVISIEDGSPCKIETTMGKKVTSQSVIVATCSPVNNRFIIHTKQAAYRTYVIGASVPKGVAPRGLYWDTAEPYHYIRVQKKMDDDNHDWVLIGGEDHRTGEKEGDGIEYEVLEKWARERLPKMGELEYRWSGQVFEPVDSLAFIGRNPHDKYTFIVTGHSGNGLTHGTIAGMLLPDLIYCRKNEWEKLYEPSRKTLSSVPKFLSENLDTALQYYDWLTPGDRNEIELLPKNEGMILRTGMKKLAVFRDTENQVHISSAFCPHLGGCVRWNPNEKSWDCPCHGSRFDGCGKVLNGPAISNLSPHDTNQKN